MRIGFTGTSDGMTRIQAEVFSRTLLDLNPTEFHHGDCVGADTQAHDRASSISSIKIVLHPPINPQARSFCKLRPTDESFVRKEYLVRNRDIVDCTECLLATPGQMTEILRSGTWSTVRYARKQKKMLIIIFPDGTVNEDNR